MKRLAILIALSLTACGPEKGLNIAAAPAPLAATSIDEDVVSVGFEAFDMALYAVDALVAAGKIVKGSPRALDIKSKIAFGKNALNAARAAQKAGNTTSYSEALAEAGEALRLVKTALKGN
jgi:hypothetical protein